MTKSEAQIVINRKAVKTAELFSTALGQEVLGFLIEEFDGSSLLGQTPELTYYNLGRRDTVVYIKELIAQQRKLERENEKNDTVTSDS